MYSTLWMRLALLAFLCFGAVLPHAVDETSFVDPFSVQHVVLGISYDDFLEDSNFHLDTFRTTLGKTLNIRAGDINVLSVGSRGPWVLLGLDVSEIFSRQMLDEALHMYQDCVSHETRGKQWHEVEHEGVDCSSVAGYPIGYTPGVSFALHEHGRVARARLHSRHMLDTTTFSETERAALVALYKHLGGSGWTLQSGWSDTSGTVHPCDWYGITCDTARTTVLQIRLPKNNMTLTPQDDASNSTRRRVLAFDDGSVEDVSQRGVNARASVWDAVQAERVDHILHSQLARNPFNMVGESRDVVHEFVGLSDSTRSRTSPRTPSPRTATSARTARAHAQVSPAYPSHWPEHVRGRRLLDSSEGIPFVTDEIMMGLPNITFIDVSVNFLTGCVMPDNIGIYWPKLTTLGLFETGITGSLPDSLAQVPLKVLHLGIGVMWCTGPLSCSSEFAQASPRNSFLTLANYTALLTNTMSGPLTPLASLTTLEKVVLDYNTFSDDVGVICGHPVLQYWGAGSNGLTGSIPDCIGNITTLKVLAMASNHLEGEIPAALSNCSLSFLLLSSNSLSGSIPQSFTNTSAWAFLLEIHLNLNALSGSIPDPLYNLRLLTTLNLNANKFSGSLSANFPKLSSAAKGVGPYFVFVALNELSGAMPNVSSWGNPKLLAFHSNQFSGSIPTYFSNMTGLLQLTLGLNHFAGSLPAEVFVPSLLALSLESLPGVNGTFPTSVTNMTVATTLVMTDMRLTGTIPTEICKMKSLQSLRLEIMEGISGSLPECLGDLTSVKTLKIEYLNITGGLPYSIGRCTSLTSIIVSNCRLDANQMPSSLSNLTKLTEIVVSHNSLSGANNNFLSPLSQLPALINVDMSYNALTSEFAIVTFSGTATIPRFPSLYQLILSHNQITGAIPAGFGSLTALRVLDLSYNQLYGGVPGLYSSVTYMDISNNKLGCATDDEVQYEAFCDEQLPSIFALLDTSAEINANPTVLCPQVTHYSHSAVIIIDALFYNYTLCRCKPGYFGERGLCQLCLAGGLCPGGSSSEARLGNDVVPLPVGLSLEDVYVVPAKIGAQKGFYPTPSLTAPTHMEECPVESLDSSMCNPDESLDFECSDGYEGRLCGECVIGYYRQGMSCVKCPEDDTLRGMALAFIIILVVAFACLVVQNKRFMRLDDAMKSFLFYTQTVSLIFTNTGFTWPASILYLNKFYTSANISITMFSCFSTERLPFVQDYVVAVTPGIWALGLAIMFYSTGMLFLVALQVSSESLRMHWLRCVHAFLFALNIVYLPITVLIFQIFLCNEDEGDGKKYMQFFPSVECDMDGDYGKVYRLNVFFLIFHVIGIPVFYYFLLYMNRKKLFTLEAAYMLRFLYQSYHPEYYWFELYTFVRRTLLGFFATLLGLQSAYTPFFIGLVIIGSTIFQAYFRPFISFSLNAFEAIAHVVLGITFMCGLIFTSADDPDSYALTVIENFVLAINASMAVFFLLVAIRIVLFRRKVFGFEWDDPELEEVFQLEQNAHEDFEADIHGLPHKPHDTSDSCTPSRTMTPKGVSAPSLGSHSRHHSYEDPVRNLSKALSTHQVAALEHYPSEPISSSLAKDIENGNGFGNGHHANGHTLVKSKTMNFTSNRTADIIEVSPDFSHIVTEI